MDADTDNNPDGNGIVCSGGMAANDPLCAEQFANSSVASLKVVSEPGYELAYWEMNGGILQQADAGPLFLSTMPMLAGIVPIPSTTNTATLKAHCLSLSLESVTFEGMSAPQVLQDSGVPYPGPPSQPHWKKTDNASYKPSPVVFTSGSTMTAKATFTVEPADFSGTLTIQARGTDASGQREFLFPPQDAVVTNGTASVTLPGSTTFPDNTVDFFEPLNVAWSYQTASGRFQYAGTSENQVYVTFGDPQTFVYHTLVHLGCKNAKGQTTEAGTVSAIWEEFKDNKVMNVAGTRLRYYQPDTGNTTTDKLLQTFTGQCSAWANFFIDILQVQNIPAIITEVVEQHEQPQMFHLLVKEWDLTGEGDSSATAPYIYIIDGLNNPREQDGVPGQGNLDPPSEFERHYIVKYIDTTSPSFPIKKLYDPSYGNGGKDAFLSPDAWENHSLAGFAALKDVFIDGQEERRWLAKPNDVSVIETHFNPEF